MISALNGLAGLALLKNSAAFAVERYREALKEVEKAQSEGVKTDSLLQMHTLHNLDDVLKNYQSYVDTSNPGIENAGSGNSSSGNAGSGNAGSGNTGFRDTASVSGHTAVGHTLEDGKLKEKELVLRDRYCVEQTAMVAMAEDKYRCVCMYVSMYVCIYV